MSNERSFENIDMWVKKVQEKHDKKNIPGNTRNNYRIFFSKMQISEGIPSKKQVFQVELNVTDSCCQLNFHIFFLY